MRISTDHPIYVGTSTALGAVAFPRLVELTAVMELCSYILASIASLITIAIAIKRWHDKRHRYDGSDNENL